MKNWLIEKLGGVPKQTYMAAAESYEDTLATQAQKIEELQAEIEAKNAEIIAISKMSAWIWTTA